MALLVEFIERRFEIIIKALVYVSSLPDELCDDRIIPLKVLQMSEERCVTKKVPSVDVGSVLHKSLDHFDCWVCHLLFGAFYEVEWSFPKGIRTIRINPLHE
uniref:Uncharacterized protein n=1 Tax=Fusarium oxysporum (strain Fo5176) TaxID=660025 RepID=A0A0D2XK57_FUSOF